MHTYSLVHLWNNNKFWQGITQFWISLFYANSSWRYMSRAQRKKVDVQHLKVCFQRLKTVLEMGFTPPPKTTTLPPPCHPNTPTPHQLSSHKVVKKYAVKRVAPWSSTNGGRFTCKSLWVRIPTPNTRWNMTRVVLNRLLNIWWSDLKKKSEILLTLKPLYSSKTLLLSLP